MNISIIIPTLNEEDSLSELLSGLRTGPKLEIIIADGGSQDQTVAIANKNNITVISGKTGRGRQLNMGARAATGETLLFLHSDTILPQQFASLIQNTLAEPTTVAGAFQLAINAPEKKFRLIEWGAKIRSKKLHLIYGDQAIFVRKNVFFKAGGFPEQAILEDIEFVRNLKRCGKVTVVPAKVVTSARRWQQVGVCRATIINQLMLLGFIIKINPDSLARFYYRNTFNDTKK